MVGGTGSGAAYNATVVVSYRRHWECVSCGYEHVSDEAGVIMPTHPCSTVGGLSVPLVEAGTKGKIVVQPWADYQKNEITQNDQDGRPISSTTVVTDDREHVAILAPTAHASLRST